MFEFLDDIIPLEEDEEEVLPKNRRKRCVSIADELVRAMLTRPMVYVTGAP